MTQSDSSANLVQPTDSGPSKEGLRKYFDRWADDEVWVTKPRNVDELVEILTRSTSEHIPFTPYAPGLEYLLQEQDSDRSMIVDVSKLDRIVDVDEASRVASIEPGVTFDSLQKAARKKDLRVLTSMELPSTASVLWAYTEMSPLYSWPRYGTEPILTMNVVLPDGKLVKTGAAALPNSGKPYSPIGPPLTLLGRIWYGSQMTLGVPVLGNVKLKSVQESNDVHLFRFEEFSALSSFITSIKRQRIGEEIFALSPLEAGLMLSEKSGKVKAEDYPSWLLVVILRGYKDEVKYQERDLSTSSKKLRLKEVDEIPGQKDSRSKILKEIESTSWVARARSYEGGRFSISFVAKNEHIPELTSLISHLDNFSSFVLPVDAGRSHCNIAFHSNSERRLKILDELKKIVPDLIDHGAFFSRPYGFLANIVYSRNERYYSLLKEIKQSIDPDHLLSRGRLGF